MMNVEQQSMRMPAIDCYFLIMAIICPSCHKICKNNQGLTKHRQTCPKLSATIALLKKRLGKTVVDHSKDTSASGSGVSDNHDAEQFGDVRIFIRRYIDTDLLLTSMMIWM
jgi:hypothetical protein